MTFRFTPTMQLWPEIITLLKELARQREGHKLIADVIAQTLRRVFFLSLLVSTAELYTALRMPRSYLSSFQNPTPKCCDVNLRPKTVT